jgi:hypothetical protein
MKQAGTFTEFNYSLKTHPRPTAKSLLSLEDKSKGKVRLTSSGKSTEKYNPLHPEFLMEKSNAIPWEGRKTLRN